MYARENFGTLINARISSSGDWRTSNRLLLVVAGVCRTLRVFCRTMDDAS